MKFYNREKELQLLQEIEATSLNHSMMTVLVGRRRIGNFWNKKGNHETDIILINEQERLLRIGEIKRQAKNIDMHTLEDKAMYFISLHPHLQSYTRELLSLSMLDM